MPKKFELGMVDATEATYIAQIAIGKKSAQKTSFSPRKRGIRGERN
jgi:hypothetical protein